MGNHHEYGRRKGRKDNHLTVNVTKEGAADPEDILALGTLVTDVKEKFPAADEGDYTLEAWKNLQDALKEAEGYTAAAAQRRRRFPA